MPGDQVTFEEKARQARDERAARFKQHLAEFQQLPPLPQADEMAGDLAVGLEEAEGAVADPDPAEPLDAGSSEIFDRDFHVYGGDKARQRSGTVNVEVQQSIAQQVQVQKTIAVRQRVQARQVAARREQVLGDCHDPVLYDWVLLYAHYDKYKNSLDGFFSDQNDQFMHVSNSYDTWEPDKPFIKNAREFLKNLGGIDYISHEALERLLPYYAQLRDGLNIEQLPPGFFLQKHTKDFGKKVLTYHPHAEDRSDALPLPTAPAQFVSMPEDLFSDLTKPLSLGCVSPDLQAAYYPSLFYFFDDASVQVLQKLLREALDQPGMPPNLLLFLRDYRWKFNVADSQEDCAKRHQAQLRFMISKHLGIESDSFFKTLSRAAKTFAQAEANYHAEANPHLFYQLRELGTKELPEGTTLPNFDNLLADFTPKALDGLCAIIYEQDYAAAAKLLHTFATLKAQDPVFFQQFKATFLDTSSNLTPFLSSAYQDVLRQLSQCLSQYSDTSWTPAQKQWWHEFTKSHVEAVGFADLPDLFEAYQAFLTFLVQAELELPVYEYPEAIPHPKNMRVGLWRLQYMLEHTPYPQVQLKELDQDSLKLDDGFGAMYELGFYQIAPEMDVDVLFLTREQTHYSASLKHQAYLYSRTYTRGMDDPRHCWRLIGQTPCALPVDCYRPLMVMNRAFADPSSALKDGDYPANQRYLDKLLALTTIFEANDATFSNDWERLHQKLKKLDQIQIPGWVVKDTDPPHSEALLSDIMAYYEKGLKESDENFYPPRIDQWINFIDAIITELTHRNDPSLVDDARVGRGYGWSDFVGSEGLIQALLCSGSARSHFVLRNNAQGQRDFWLGLEVPEGRSVSFWAYFNHFYANFLMERGNPYPGYRKRFNDQEIALPQGNLPKLIADNFDEAHQAIWSTQLCLLSQLIRPFNLENLIALESALSKLPGKYTQETIVQLLNLINHFDVLPPQPLPPNTPKQIIKVLNTLADANPGDVEQSRTEAELREHIRHHWSQYKDNYHSEKDTHFANAATQSIEEIIKNAVPANAFTDIELSQLIACCRAYEESATSQQIQAFAQKCHALMQSRAFKNQDILTRSLFEKLSHLDIARAIPDLGALHFVLELISQHPHHMVLIFDVFFEACTQEETRALASETIREQTAQRWLAQKIAQLDYCPSHQDAAGSVRVSQIESDEEEEADEEDEKAEEPEFLPPLSSSEKDAWIKLAIDWARSPLMEAAIAADKESEAQEPVAVKQLEQAEKAFFKAIFQSQGQETLFIAALVRSVLPHCAELRDFQSIKTVILALRAFPEADILFDHWAQKPALFTGLCSHYAAQADQEEELAENVITKLRIIGLLSSGHTDQKHAFDQTALLNALDAIDHAPYLEAVLAVCKKPLPPSAPKVRGWLDAFNDSEQPLKALQAKILEFECYPKGRGHKTTEKTDATAENLDKLVTHITGLDDGQAVSEDQQTQLKQQLENIRAQADTLNELSDQKLFEKAQEFKQADLTSPPSEHDLCDRLALTREVLYRTTGLYADDAQLLVALTAFTKQRIALQVATGEGKSVDTLLIAAAYWMMGKEQGVDLATLNVGLLARRDFESFQGFFQSLGCPVSLITAHSTPEDYHQDGVCYGSVGGLQLFHDRLTVAGQSVNQTKRLCVVDENDRVFFDDVLTAFNFAKNLGPLLEVTGQSTTDWIYPLLRDFVKSESFDSSTKPNAQLKGFAQYLKNLKTKSLTRAQKEQFQSFFPEQLNAWIDAASVVFIEDSLVEDINFMVLPEEKEIQGQRQTVYVIKVLQNGLPHPNAQFAEGVQQLLSVKLNAEREHNKILIDEEKPIVHTSDVHSFLSAYDDGRLVCLSGSQGDRREAAEMKAVHRLGAVFDMPTFRPSRRVDDPLYLVNGFEQKVAAALREIQQNPKSPFLIICENAQKSKKMYDALKARLDSNQLQHVNGQSTNTANGTVDKSEAIKKAGQVGMVTISTPMFGRGTHIVIDEAALKAAGANRLGLSVLYCVNQLESLESRNRTQVKGRAGRRGQVGYTQILWDISALERKPSALFHNPWGFIKQRLAQFSATKSQDRMLHHFARIVIDQLQTRFFASSPEDPGIFSSFHQNKDQVLNQLANQFMLKIAAIKKQVLLEDTKTEPKVRMERFLTEVEKAWNEFLKEVAPDHLEAELAKFQAFKQQLDIDKYLAKDTQAATDNAVINLPTVSAYNPALAGRAFISSVRYPETRALFAGKRKLFANTRAWLQGRGILFANTRASLAGKRPWFAHTRAWWAANKTEPEFKRSVFKFIIGTLTCVILFAATAGLAAFFFGIPFIPGLIMPGLILGTVIASAVGAGVGGLLSYLTYTMRYIVTGNEANTPLFMGLLTATSGALIGLGLLVLNMLPIAMTLVTLVVVPLVTFVVLAFVITYVVSKIPLFRAPTAEASNAADDPLSVKPVAHNMDAKRFSPPGEGDAHPSGKQKGVTGGQDPGSDPRSSLSA